MENIPVTPPQDFIVRLPETAPVPPPKSSKSKKLYLILASFGIVILVIAAYIAVVVVNHPQSLIQVTPSPTPFPTPTPERLLSPIATQSAFLSLETHVASLSAGINNFILEDPALTLPVLELPLRF